VQKKNKREPTVFRTFSKMLQRTQVLYFLQNEFKKKPTVINIVSKMLQKNLA